MEEKRGDKEEKEQQKEREWRTKETQVWNMINTVKQADRGTDMVRSAAENTSNRGGTVRKERKKDKFC